MSLILVGFFCVGKSTVGKLLAKRLHLPFIDTDRTLEKQQGKSISQIFQDLGVMGFRKEECRLLEEIQKPSVIATGGGAPLYKKSRQILQKKGSVIYLHATFSALYERIEKRGYPIFINREEPYEHCKQLFEERLPFYYEIADQVIDTTFCKPNMSVASILNSYGKQ